MDEHWLHQGGYRTYQLAALLDSISTAPLAYARDLEALTLDEAIYSFVRPWPKDTLLHAFARYVADMLFYDDTDAKSLHRVFDSEKSYEIQKWILPVESALIRYGLGTLDEAFAVPYAFDEKGHIRFDEDAAWQHFCEEIRLAEPYEVLLEHIADEVFHILFHNRRVLAGLNQWISGQVENLDGEGDNLFAAPGMLKRKAPPQWVKDAVFHRDQGRCATCKTDLTGILTVVTDDQYDHMIPLARGGLNDVTNIQLLCQSCNNAKADQITAPSDIYPRLVPKVPK